MDSPKERKAAILAEALAALWADAEPEMLAVVVELADREADEISSAFYTVLLEGAESNPFLSHSLVQDRLRPSLGRWVREVFHADTPEKITAILEKNYQIGAIHARINIPLTLVNAGMRIVKRELSRRLVETGLDRARIGQAAMFVSELLDTVQDSMHEAYLGDLMGNVRNQQSLKMFMTNQNLAIEGERLKSSLFDWLRNVVVSLYTRDGTQPEPARIESSDFGLWLNHKAELTFGKVQELENVRARTQAMSQKVADAAVGGAIDPSFIRDLNNDVTEITYLLGAVIDKAMEIENGRDTLTRLLTRRFMPAIFQREVNISLRHGKPFAVLLIDADHFKSINDTMGHQAGDQVLAEIADLLHTNIRAGDFVFRYGGEEFLVLLTEMDPSSMRVKAEQIRELIGSHKFHIGGEGALAVTASVGAALHEGHPDYDHTVRRADAALYEAKRQGRNRVVYG